MSIWGRRVSIKLIALVVVIVIVGALAAAVSRTPSREIVLVVRNMAFYLEGDPAHPNPTLTINAGERVRVVLRNEERGFTHDFAVPVVGSRTDLINWNEDSAVTFDAPERPGTYEYICEPHAMMMRGQIVVR